MRTSCTRFVPTAAVLASAMLLGAPSFAQPDAASKTSTTTRAAVKAEANASNAIPNAGAKQDPQVDKPAAVTKATKEEKLAARAKRKAEIAASGSSSNPKNPPSNPTGNAALDVGTSAMPTTKN